MDSRQPTDMHFPQLSGFERQHFSSADIAEYREILAPMWNVELNQLSSGTFHAELELVKTPRLIVYQEKWDRRLFVQGNSPAGHLMFAHSSAELGSWRGETLSSKRLVIEQPSSAVDFSTKSEHAVLLVSPEVLQEHLGALDTTSLTNPRLQGLAAEPQLIRQFRAGISRMLSRHRGSTHVEPGETAAHESEMLDLLRLIIQPTAGEVFSFRKRSKRAQALAQMFELIRSSDEFHSIPELSDAVGVSQRTLDYAFREAFGLPPSQFLRWLRLNHMYRTLLDAQASQTKITDIALNSGFTELGRMAAEYRELFGELPSATLKRNRRTPDTRLPFANTA